MTFEELREAWVREALATQELIAKAEGDGELKNRGEWEYIMRNIFEAGAAAQRKYTEYLKANERSNIN